MNPLVLRRPATHWACLNQLAGLAWIDFVRFRMPGKIIAVSLGVLHAKFRVHNGRVTCKLSSELKPRRSAIAELLALKQRGATLVLDLRD